MSPDGKDVYATSVASNTVVILSRSRSTGSLTQLGSGAGCIANVATPGCATGRALAGPDIVAVSPDGKSVYVGAFKGSALGVFSRNTSTGALTQPTDTTGCIVEIPTAGCATALALANPEGLTVSADGANVYVAAPGSSAVDAFTRNTSTGALTQATDGSGCIVSSPLAGCTPGVQLAGADAVVGQSRRRQRLRDRADEQHRDGVHPHVDRPAHAAQRHVGVRHQCAGGRLLAGPQARRTRGPGRLARRRQRLRGASPPARSTSSIATPARAR